LNSKELAGQLEQELKNEQNQWVKERLAWAAGKLKK
jgi:hypothetical protein